MTGNRRILLFGDPHAPYHHPDAIAFLTALQEGYKFDRVICGGDEVDNHAISFHDTDPDLPFSASSELSEAKKFMKALYGIFPAMDVLESNHGSLMYRRAKKHGIPREVFRSWADILEAPTTYKWHYDLIVKMSNGQDLYLHHSKNKNPTLVSKAMGMCAAQAHHHGQFKIEYWSIGKDIKWGVSMGCLADSNSLAMAYGRNNLPQPIMGATVVLNGSPFLMPMIVDENNRWIGSL